MNKSFLIIFLIFLTGCTTSQVSQVTSAILKGNPKTALISYTKNKAINIANKNIRKIINKFEKIISGTWGKEAKKPQKKVYVKYTQNYKSMAQVDFDTGIIIVKTVDTKNPKQSLKNAIITTLLTPNDPRAIDMYSAKEIKLSGTPYLYKEIKDHTGKYIQYNWRASSYAAYLIKNALQIKQITTNNKKQKVYSVTFHMVKDHLHIRAKKYTNTITKYANQFNISKNLIFSIIQTESNFNPFAISSIPAYGLMQIVPKSAGRDVYNYLYKKDVAPSKNYLFNTTHNIKFGTAYLKIIKTKYLEGIQNPISKEYCIISAYNTGAGNVLRTFSKNKITAVNIINSMTPSQIYNKLITSLPYKETRRYLQKVLKHKKEFVKL
jgi:membrane-bound lytic murein transglycosylase C